MTVPSSGGEAASPAAAAAARQRAGTTPGPTGTRGFEPRAATAADR